MALAKPRVTPRSAVVKPGPVERNRENEQNVTYENVSVTVIAGPVSHGGQVYTNGETFLVPLPGALNLIACGRVTRTP
jgi:hypothetical protein